jgi:putative membrane protein
MKPVKNFRSLKASLLASVMLLATPVFSQTPTLSDAEIASVAVTANQIDVDYAGIAMVKSKDASVLRFAKTMADDHNSIIKQAVALVTKLKVTPKDNKVSQSLLSDAKKTKKALHAKSGKAFDKAYIDNEVAYHKAVINAVEGLLIPQAKNAELKSLLESALPLLKTHLAHAEMVQKNYK